MLALLQLPSLAAPAPATRASLDRCSNGELPYGGSPFDFFTHSMKEHSSFLAVLATVMLGALLIAIASTHQAYVDSCVCVVNSAARAFVALAVTAAIGVVLGLGASGKSKIGRAAGILQAISFITALFFLVQHVFFVLELA